MTRAPLHAPDYYALALLHHTPDFTSWLCCADIVHVKSLRVTDGWQASATSAEFAWFSEVALSVLQEGLPELLTRLLELFKTK